MISVNPIEKLDIGAITVRGICYHSNYAGRFSSSCRNLYSKRFCFNAIGVRISRGVK